ncbi:TIGR02391 family protein [Candidatus Woesebacteria bacterium]|nr:TIGR02391 family protein [Candidatus Woesebacteria bacterium]
MENFISKEKDGSTLLAIKCLAKSSMDIKKNISVGDDGEWDYKLNKAINPLKEDLTKLSSIDIDSQKNNYNGNLTIELLLEKFSDFYELLATVEPLGELESKFKMAYEFLNSIARDNKNRSGPYKFNPWTNIHDRVTNVSKSRYESKQYADSVEAAFKEVIRTVKNYVNSKTKSKYDGVRAMSKAFDFDSQNPLIKFNILKTDEEKDEQRGIAMLYKGIVFIRNRKAHENIILDDPNRAFEYISLASLLMRLFDKHAK